MNGQVNMTLVANRLISPTWDKNPLSNCPNAFQNMLGCMMMMTDDDGELA